MRQAEADLAMARRAADAGSHEWACFISQQAAEKALEAVHLAQGRDAWGHSVAGLLRALEEGGRDLPPGLLDRGRALDKLYVPTRYPNGLPEGAPAECFTAGEARQAIEHAEALLAFCRGMLPG